MKFLSTSISFLLLLAAFGCGTQQNGKYAFVDNVRLFNGFDGRKELQKHLDTLVNRQNEQVDSIKLQLVNFKNNPAVFQQQAAMFKQLQEELMLIRQEKEKQYTDQVWKQLNEYVKEYSEKNRLEVVFGGSGNGSIMFASKNIDITDDVLIFANKKYAGN